MGPGLRMDLTLCRLLDTVVADGGSRVQCLGDLVVGQRLEEPRGRGVVRPHAGETVGLQLRAYGRASCALLA